MMRPSTEAVAGPVRLACVGLAAVSLVGCGDCREDTAKAIGKVPGVFLTTSTALLRYYRGHGEYPPDLRSAGVVGEQAQDPFTGRPVLYATVSDASGARYACLLAISGRDRQFQVTPSHFTPANAGRLPGKWEPPVQVVLSVREMRRTWYDSLLRRNSTRRTGVEPEYPKKMVN